MGLQTDNLSMIGLGVLGNQPVNPYQPTVADGIHLRWGFLRELGFPWHGFYLFRRPAQAGRPLCLSGVTGGLKKRMLTEKEHYTAIGRLSSDAILVVNENFAPENQVEFALDRRSYLRFDLPADELARRFELRVGFLPEKCVDFERLIPQPTPPALEVTRPNPFIEQWGSIAVRDANGQLLTKTQFKRVNTIEGPVLEGSQNLVPLMGLNCGNRATIELTAPSDVVLLMITRTPAMIPAGAKFFIEAFDSQNNKVASVQLKKLASQQETVELSAKNISRIEIPWMLSTAYLHRVCSDKINLEAEVELTVTAFSGTTPVHNATLAGLSGQIVSATIEAEDMTAVELSSGPGSLVDLCYVPVAQGATKAWEKLPEFSYPLGLPVTHKDYPCSVDDPQSLVTERVRYPLPPGWDGTTFTELHDQLVKLVEGGSGGLPMVDRIFSASPEGSDASDINVPKLSKFYILDMVLLGALNPALAQLLGLYWVDQTADLNVAYDYLIVADHAGVAEGKVNKVLSIIEDTGFTELDGYIVFNKRLEPAADLPAPVGLQTYELPGGAFPDAQGQLPQSSNHAGLRWDVGWNESGELLPEHAVMYLVWRADLGNGATPDPVGNYNLITKILPDSPRPILVTEPRVPNGVVPQRPPDWPAVPLHYIDRNLPDGWCNWQVSGVDLFGRHSPNSSPSQLLLRDKIPPPMPTAVEAYALDPDDPFLQRDEAYQNWHNSLDASIQQILVGLRVRWIWTWAHQQQARDTHEFRIYFHPGAALPPDHDQAINWQERYYVLGYDDNVTIDSVTGQRFYEVFIPSAVDSNPTSLPLNPSLAEPVIYAHIGVSAADNKPHTNDLRMTGNWSNRPGNEGSVITAKIYRVLRTLPPPPEDVFAGDRLHASPADYYSRSFFTYRWHPQQFLNLHVFRAMDDAVFKADWTQRPAATLLDQSQLNRFPSGWNQATREAVAIELNQLDNFAGLENGRAQAMNYYRTLSDAALRVLAGLPSSESAFVQLTINPLDPNDVANANRLGPNDPDDLVLDPNHRAFIDTVDGRATNRYFYRAAFVDGAHNLGPLGLSSPPVYLPNVVPPRAPVITKVLGGDRQITIKWASNREPDLAEYRVYRTDNEVATRDLPLMTLVHTMAEPISHPSSRPAEVTWIDASMPSLTSFYYRLVAVDSAGNVSDPSPLVIGRGYDDSHPDPPTWYPLAGTETPNELQLSWVSPVTTFACLVQRRVTSTGEWRNLSVWLARGEYAFKDSWREAGMTYDYRLRVIDAGGRSNKDFIVLTA